jgi:phosphoglycerol transferase MdoB-like AlkP superfamily enzyme
MEKQLKLAYTIARLLDNQFELGGIRFGIDPIMGLIPGLGDLVSAILALYFVYLAAEMKVPKRLLVIVILNVVLDYILGLLPFIGDLADVAFKANMRNYLLLKKYWENQNNIIEGEIVK